MGPLRRLLRRHRDNNHWHAYYAIPALFGFLLMYGILQLGAHYLPDVYFTAKGYHIHHYTYGIVILLIFGYVGIWAQSLKAKNFCAFAYGVGAALIIDEAWIWFTLNPGPGYQDYDLAFYVAAIILSIALAPLLFKNKKHCSCPATPSKISIVIPARNEEQLIRATLAAACAQTYPNFEVIVVDNNSTDRTADIVREFPAVRLVHEPKQGILMARERGRASATGEIIANLDADCIPPADWLARGARYFNDPAVAGVSGPYDFSDGPWYFRSVARALQKGLFPVISGISSFLFKKGAIPMGGNMFIRADALRKAGGYDTAIKFYGEDTDTTRRLSAVGKVLYAPSIAVQSSARRFQRLGIFTTQGKYILNYLWITVFKKPYHDIQAD